MPSLSSSYGLVLRALEHDATGASVARVDVLAEREDRGPLALGFLARRLVLQQRDLAGGRLRKEGAGRRRARSRR